MKSTAVRVVIAIALFIGCALAVREARDVRDIRAAYERLSTLHYDSEADLDQLMPEDSRLPWKAAMHDEVERQRVTVAYWRSRQDSASPMPATSTTAGAAQPPQAPQTMLAKANGLFRATQRFNGDRRVAVERLDAVVRAYADVLRADASAADAAFNLEYVTRLRDTVAKGRGPLRSVELQTGVAATGESSDLPSGTTVHGVPGGPPPAVKMEEFKTLVPKMQEERQEPGGGQRPPRRG
jgi:hypothetical protein